VELSSSESATASLAMPSNALRPSQGVDPCACLPLTSTSAHRLPLFPIHTFPEPLASGTTT
jgi:hypothetical protein